VSYIYVGLAIYIKMYLKAKEELSKLKYFTMQKYNHQKILSKKPKSFKIYITNLKPKYRLLKILI